MKHNGLMASAAVAALMTTGDPAYAGSLPAQVDAARAAAFAEADADGDGRLDPDERAVFGDLLRAPLEELNPDDVIEDGAGGEIYHFRRAMPAPEGGESGQQFEIFLHDGEGPPPGPGQGFGIVIHEGDGE